MKHRPIVRQSPIVKERLFESAIPKGHELAGEPHEAAAEPSCATCRLKERVYITSPEGTQHAAIWRCRELSERFRREVIVRPDGNCYENNSLTDYYLPQEAALYIW